MITNSQWVIIDTIIYLMMIIPFLMSIKYKSSRGLYIHVPKTHGVIPLYLCLILFFCIFDKCGGDYFHYQELAYNLKRIPDDSTNLESIYVWLLKQIDHSYMLFRIIVWGLALIFYSCILKRLHLLRIESLWIFLLVSLVNFSYARVSLGLAMFFYGYIRFCDRKNLKDIFWGGVFMIASCFFHKSIIILLFLSCFSWIRFNKWIIAIAVVAFPIFVYLINVYLADYLQIAEVASAGGGGYLYMEREAKGLAAKLEDLLRFVPIIIFLIMMAKEYFGRRMPRYVKRLYTLVIIILYAASVLSFMDFGSSAISYRIRNMALMPFGLLLSYYIGHWRMSKLHLACYLLLLFATLFYFMYMYYLKSIGLGI